jgi:allantoicase
VSGNELICIEVTVETLGGKVLSVSDDFFASKDNLIKPHVSYSHPYLWLISQPSVSMKGQFGPTGALYDAWESRRHNPSFDWYVPSFEVADKTG